MGNKPKKFEKNSTLNVNPTDLSPLPDGITLIWLDAKANCNSIDSRNTRQMLEQIQIPLRLFEDTNNCLQLLNSNTNLKARVFLIVSGKFSQEILPPIVESVFIYCIDSEKYRSSLSKHNSRINGIYNKLEELKSAIRTALGNYDVRASILQFFSQKQSPIRDLTYRQASFLWFQLLQKLLLKTQYQINDMKEMLEYCREYYADNRKFLSQIDEFEANFTPSNAIYWYTRQTFVYKIINRALRTEDIQALYIFRYYISCLCQQLKSQHELLCRTSPEIIVYRGCRMTLDELNKLQEMKGQLTSINGFISTSIEPIVAEAFSSLNSNRGIDVRSVLWIIKVNCQTEGVICANVEEFSQHPHEQEILFNIGTTFSIENVEFNEQTGCWNIYATATNAGLSAVNDYLKLIESELNETNEKVIFGILLTDMGQYQIAQKYFQDLIQTQPNIPAFHYNLGLIHSFQYNYELAEYHFEKALEFQKCNSQQQRNLIRTTNALGLIHQENGDFTKALEFYQQAESICNREFASDDIANAQTYTYFGRYYLQKRMYEKSKEYYDRAMKILFNHLPEGHQRFGILWTEIGNIHRNENNLDEALKIYGKAECIFENILPEHHPCLAYCWSMMGLAYLQKGDLNEARRFHQKALFTYKLVLSNDHPNIEFSKYNLSCDNVSHIVDTYIQVCSQV